jgi:hypothetical protein
VRLNSAEKAKIDAGYSPELAPTSAEQRFSVEIWARPGGGWDLRRVLLMSSRYCLVATRENRWAFHVYDRHVQATLMGPEIARGRWAHLVCTYDGTVVRMYVDSVYAGGVELTAELEKRLEELTGARREAYNKLEGEEKAAKDGCWRDTEKEAEVYFRSKDGRALLRQQTMKMLEQAEYEARVIAAAGLDDDEDGEVVGKKKQVAQRLTKVRACRGGRGREGGAMEGGRGLYTTTPFEGLVCGLDWHARCAEDVD